MAIKPVNNPTDWATDTNGVALKMETTEYHKQYGWGIVSNIPEVPNLNEVNYWRFSVHEWLQYLDTAGGERDTEIAQLNDRLDNLSSDQVSYEFSNEDSSNIYAVDFNTFTEFDGTTSTRYRLEGDVVTLENDASSYLENTLSLTSASANDDIAIRFSDDEARFKFNDFEKKAVNNSPITRKVRSASEVFKNRFKIGASEESGETFSFRYSGFNSSTGQYDLSTAARYITADGINLLSLHKSETIAAGIFYVEGRFEVLLFTYATKEIKTAVIDTINVGNPITGTDKTLRAYPACYAAQGWILQPEIDNVHRDVFVFVMTFIDPDASGTFDNNLYDYLYMMEDNPGMPVISKMFSLQQDQGALCNYPESFAVSEFGYFFKEYNVSVDEESPNCLVLDSFTLIGGTGGDPGVDINLNAFTGGSQKIYNVDRAQSNLAENVPYFTRGARQCSRLVSNGIDQVTLKCSTTNADINGQYFKTTWSNLSEPDGVFIVAGVAKFNGDTYLLNEASGGNYLDHNVLVFKRGSKDPDAPGTDVYVLNLDSIYRLGPPETNRPDSQSSSFNISGISSLSLVQRSGTQYTFTVGYQQGKAAVDTSKKVLLCNDRILDTASGTFNSVAGTEVYTDTLTEAEGLVWRRPANMTGFTYTP